MATFPLLFLIIFSTKNCTLQYFNNVHYMGSLFLQTLYYILRTNSMFNISHRKGKLNNVFGLVHGSCQRKLSLKANKTYEFIRKTFFHMVSSKGFISVFLKYPVKRINFHNVGGKKIKSLPTERLVKTIPIVPSTLYTLPPSTMERLCLKVGLVTHIRISC